MKVTNKNLSIVTVIIFLIGIVIVAYYLYQAPTSLSGALGIQELRQKKDIENFFAQVNLVIGVEIGLGLLAIIFLLIISNNQDRVLQTVSADTSESISENNSSEETQSTTLSERIANIEVALQQSYPDIKVMLEKVLASICNELEACQGALFLTNNQEEKRIVELAASYAYFFAESKSVAYEFGEGLVGQVAKEGKLINIHSIPQGYVTIISGLGSSSPNHLIILPLTFENTTLGVIEIASFKKFTKEDESLLTQLSLSLSEQIAKQNHAFVTE
jgi:transcriptional regulator with GAF, ATPase, and Fis domain